MMESQIQILTRRDIERNHSTRKESVDSMELEWPLDVSGGEYRLQKLDDQEEEEMDDDPDWCADSLAVELSSVESAAMTGFMGMLHGASSSESMAVRSSHSTSSKSPKIVPSSSSTRNIGHRSTTNGSAEDSDGCSISSYRSASLKQAKCNGQHRNTGSTGDASVVFPMAPPSSPNVFNQLTDFLPSTAFTSPVLRRDTSAFQVPLEAHRSPMPFADTTQLSSPLEISIPNEKREWRYDDHTYVHANTLPHTHPVIHLGEAAGGSGPGGAVALSQCEYRVDEADSDVDSTATVQSLAVEVESLDEEGTYMSYGGDCEDLDTVVNNVEYEEYAGSNEWDHDHANSHSLHSSGHFYLGSDAEGDEVRSEHSHPLGYTYGHTSAVSSGGSGGVGGYGHEQRRGHHRGFSVGSVDAVEMQPSPPPLRHPRVRKSYPDLGNGFEDSTSYDAHFPELLRSFSTDHTTVGSGERESAEESMYYVHDSASPSSLYQQSIETHRLYNVETTQPNQHSIYPITTTSTRNTTNTTHYNPSTSNTHTDTTQTYHNNTHSRHKHTHHRRATLRARPAHPEPFLSPTYVYNNHNSTLQPVGAIGTGKRKRSDSSGDSPVHKSSTLYNTVLNSNNHSDHKTFNTAMSKRYTTSNTSSSTNTSNTTINIYSGYTQPLCDSHYSDANTDTDSMVEGEGGYDGASEKGLET